MRYLVLRSAAKTQCGVEAFTRNLAERLGSRAQSHVLDRDFKRLREAIRSCDCIVLNFPIVAWKKCLLEPLAVAISAKLMRKKVVVVLHEWASLNWKRRLTLWPVVRLADALVFSAPEVRTEWRQSLFPSPGKIPEPVIPIPPNLLPASSHDDLPAALSIRALRRDGRTILGQFGSIYPKKNGSDLLDVAGALAEDGHDVAVAFVGSFIKGADDVEEEFQRQVRDRGLADRVTLTGYIATDEEVFAACREIDIFCYRFADGLTSRRGSVLAAALSGRLVVTNAPADTASLEHHDLFMKLIRQGNIILCPHDSDASMLAKAVEGLVGRKPSSLGADAEIASLWQAIITRLDHVHGFSSEKGQKRSTPGIAKTS